MHNERVVRYFLKMYLSSTYSRQPSEGQIAHWPPYLEGYSKGKNGSGSPASAYVDNAQKRKASWRMAASPKRGNYKYHRALIAALERF